MFIQDQNRVKKFFKKGFQWENCLVQNVIKSYGYILKKKEKMLIERKNSNSPRVFPSYKTFHIINIKIVLYENKLKVEENRKKGKPTWKSRLKGSERE